MKRFDDMKSEVAFSFLDYIQSRYPGVNARLKAKDNPELFNALSTQLLDLSLTESESRQAVTNWIKEEIK